MKNIPSIVWIILLWMSLGWVAATGSVESGTCQQQHCLAVVDAGSSGSRLHLFAYDRDESHQPINIHELWSKKVTPGFANLELTQSTVDAYLSHLFSDAPEQNIPVYFYATAGMRLLSQPKQKQYYHALQQWFDSQKQWPLIEAKTITGKEEGVFGWLAVNYQLGYFDDPERLPVGVMDMGGASVQISSLVQTIDNIDLQDLMSVDVSGRHLLLFVHSFLGLGQQAVSQQFLNEASCFSEGYPLPSGLAGAGDAALCRQKIATLVHHVHEVEQHIPQDMIEKTPNWYAIGGVASMADDPLFLFDSQQFTNQSLLHQADHAVCQQSWDNLSEQYPSHDYLYGYCLSSAYYYALMVDGYGFDPAQPIHLMIPGQNADWSLGVVLQQPAHAIDVKR
jgi:hypothetical protein